jgi:FKBP-type peptidyl-prolyl cis-trans isomerase
MRKTTLYTIALLSVLLIFNSCKKEYETIESIDDTKIQAYIKEKNLNMTKDPSGFYYHIINQGTGDALLNKDSVLYNFDIKSLSGTVYQGINTNGNNGTYLGYVSPTPFRIAMSKLNRGGSVQLLIPSYLAFGKNGNGNIPSNEIILTDITTFSQAKQWQLDDKRIIDFLAAKNITNAVKHPSRVYYQVITQGNGGDAIDEEHSTVVFSYTGRLLDGTVFDSSSSFSTRLNTVIQGWGKVLPMFRAGTKVRLFIPSDLAYGTASTGSIPANAVLDFDIEIVSVTNN